MCLGATLWSGVSRIVCAATKVDAEAIGFNEGPVFDASYDHLREAGIEVKKSVLQKEAAEVLRNYGANGLIYNSSGSS
jgi:tRNA(Arg) A34 adenosine deaminase TadA